MLQKSIREAGGVGSYGLTPCLLFPRAPSTFLVLPALSSPAPHHFIMWPLKPWSAPC